MNLKASTITLPEMEAHFTIIAEPEYDLLRITMSGFYTLADIEAFKTVRAREYKKLRCGPNQHVTMVDLREMKIQSQDMVLAFRDLLSDPRWHSRELALIVSSTLARMQLIRAMEGRPAHYFTNMIDADGWLMNSIRPAAA